MDKRILVLDDNEDILEIVDDLLTYEGYTVKVTASPESFSGFLKSFAPDLIILDYKLKTADGRELCRLLKSDPGTACIPIIFFSAYINFNGDLFDVQADAVIAKPFNLTDLTGTVRRLLTLKNQFNDQ